MPNVSRKARPSGREAEPREDSSQAPRDERLRVVHLVAEYWPFARTGGLAEAVRGIATFQAATGIPTTVFMPLYRAVREAHPELEEVSSFAVQVGPRLEEARVFRLPGPRRNPNVLFIDNPEYFDRDGIYGEAGSDYPDNTRRFAFFNRAVLEALPDLAEVPIVLHAHDWHTALAPIYLRTTMPKRPPYGNVATVLSVHNAGYQGHFPPETLADIGLPSSLFHWRWLEWYGRVNILKGGLAFSDYATTVSPTHAHELRTPAGGFGLHHSFITMQDRFVGIRNGIDLDIWNPESDSEIAATYSPHDLSGKRRCKAELQRAYDLPEDPEIPLFGMTARLVEQKGLDLILDDGFLSRANAQFVFLGSGEERYRVALSQAAAARPQRVAAEFDFREPLEHQLLAGADLLLMPSLYEPCGLTQMRAQRYGTLPVARRVGGLADTIEDQVTGFLFDEYSTEALEQAVWRAVDLYRSGPEGWDWHVLEAMDRDFGWESSAAKYLDVYRKAHAAHVG
jgi:starch synthase